MASSCTSSDSSGFGIVRVLLSFFRNGESEAFERHRNRLPVELEKQRELNAFRKHLVEFTGINEQCKANGMPFFDLKLFRLSRNRSGKAENYHIATNQQWLMEAPMLLSDESSELNGE